MGSEVAADGTRGAMNLLQWYAYCQNEGLPITVYYIVSGKVVVMAVKSSIWQGILNCHSY